jgi:hypothetical protein
MLLILTYYTIHVLLKNIIAIHTSLIVLSFLCNTILCKDIHKYIFKKNCPLEWNIHLHHKLDLRFSSAELEAILLWKDFIFIIIYLLWFYWYVQWMRFVVFLVTILFDCIKAFWWPSCLIVYIREQLF